MKKYMVAVLVIIGLAFVLNVPAVRAQENNEDKFSFGKVVSVAGQDVVVKEYDFAKDADVEVTYAVTAETEFGNVNAVSELAADDDIVIDYMEKDGKRVVTTLVKEDKGAEVPMQADMAAEPAAAVDAAAAPEAVPAAEAPVAAAPAADVVEQK